MERAVGFVPPQQVHIIVDDPSNSANGTAFTTLDAPTIVLWPTPPNPREEIGNFAVWSELVATHEFAHIAHLTRPSRNRWRDMLLSLSPVPLGPIATNSPRWVIEGYATQLFLRRPFLSFLPLHSRNRYTIPTPPASIGEPQCPPSN